MQQVITTEQARQITNGRTPMVPVHYENAVKSLAECMTIDDTKHWSDKADALAAWAKIYRRNDALVKAKQLKLHAFRRMGILAAELRETHGRIKRKGAGRQGALPGPRALLKESGLSTGEVDAARALSNISQRKFDSLLVHPVSPSTARSIIRGDDTAWREIARACMQLRSVARRYTAFHVVSSMTDVERTNSTSKNLIVELVEWLSEFDDRLPKAKRNAA